MMQCEGNKETATKAISKVVLLIWRLSVACWAKGICCIWVIKDVHPSLSVGLLPMSYSQWQMRAQLQLCYSIVRRCHCCMDWQISRSCWEAWESMTQFDTVRVWDWRHCYLGRKTLTHTATHSCNTWKAYNIMKSVKANSLAAKRLLSLESSGSLTEANGSREHGLHSLSY